MSARPKPRDRFNLFDAVSVIEVKHRWVDFTAIDTRMVSQVFVKLAIEILAAAAPSWPLAARVLFLVPLIVLMGVLAQAESAPRST